MAKRILPTPEQLRELLTYYPETGKLFWKTRPESMFEGLKYHSSRLAKSWNSKFAGKEAGAPNGTGHLRITLFGERIVAHWVVWAMHHNSWHDQSLEIDHENLDGTDNRISNLRLATRAQNGHNKNPPSNNISGRKGVSWHKRGAKWQVKLGFNGEQYYLGLFSSFEEAVIVRNEAAERMAGRFSREGV